LATRISYELGALVSGINKVSPTLLSATLEAQNIVEVAKKLDSLGFDHVKSVTAIDFLQENKIDMVYHLSSYLNADLAQFIFELRTSITRQDSKISSLIGIWPSSEYPERETLDLMGVTFEGLPQKERLFLLDNFEGFPLRKDFKIKTEGVDA
jgi:NADH-quinone oxidoreductase subunit C